MTDIQTIRFGIYEMQYKGGLLNSELPAITFEQKYYEKWVICKVM